MIIELSTIVEVPYDYFPTIIKVTMIIEPDY